MTNRAANGEAPVPAFRGICVTVMLLLASTVSLAQAPAGCTARETRTTSGTEPQVYVDVSAVPCQISMQPNTRYEVTGSPVQEGWACRAFVGSGEADPVSQVRARLQTWVAEIQGGSLSASTRDAANRVVPTATAINELTRNVNALLNPEGTFRSPVEFGSPGNEAGPYQGVVPATGQTVIRQWCLSLQTLRNITAAIASVVAYGEAVQAARANRIVR